MEYQDFIGLAGVPIIVGLVQLVKAVATDNPRVLPVVGVACGLAINVGLAWGTGVDMRLPVLDGIVAGLAASGLYSGVKALSGR